MLIPDFSGNPALLGRSSTPRPAVLAHNVETVPRLFKRIRPAFTYERSLDVITQARAAGLVTKSNLILGMGEEIDEVHQALRDLHRRRLRPRHDHPVPAAPPRHHPVERWVRPEEFVDLADVATQIGFAGVMSGPLVRSSYRAGRLYEQALAARASGDGRSHHRDAPA